MGRGADVAAGGDDKRVGEILPDPADSALDSDQAVVPGGVVLLGLRVVPARLQVVTAKVTQADQLDAHLVARIVGPLVPVSAVGRFLHSGGRRYEGCCRSRDHGTQGSHNQSAQRSADSCSPSRKYSHVNPRGT